MRLKFKCVRNTGLYKINKLSLRDMIILTNKLEIWKITQLALD